MKKIILSAVAMFQLLAVSAQDITLPAPDLNAPSANVIQTLKARHSVREFAQTELTPQQISNLCWAACGTSWDENHITAPSAMNRQEVRLYVFSKDGVYEYQRKTNILKKSADGDHRDIIAGRQTSVASAPVILLMVIDYAKFNGIPERDRQASSIDAGIVCQNINLYCQSVGLATVPRGSMDRKAISTLLNLTDMQEPVLNNPVGYAK